jgi:S1-C subfamily serine protease
MLVVEHVLPGSPADGVLETGDVLVRVNGQVGDQAHGAADDLCLLQRMLKC